MNHHHHRSGAAVDADTRLITTAAVLTAIGAGLTVTGLALGSLAVFTAGRRMLHRMEQAPAQKAAVKWEQAKAASRAGVQAWQVAADGRNGGSPGRA